MTDLWPLNSITHLPVCKSHFRTVLSADPVTTHCSVIAIQFTYWACPTISACSVRVSASQTRQVLSSDAVASRDPDTHIAFTLPSCPRRTLLVFGDGRSMLPPTPMLHNFEIKSASPHSFLLCETWSDIFLYAPASLEWCVTQLWCCKQIRYTKAIHCPLVRALPTLPYKHNCACVVWRDFAGQSAIEGVYSN